MQEKHISKKLLTAGMVFSMFLWGLSWPSGKVLTHYSSAVNFAIYRYVIVIAVLLPLLLFTKVPLRIKKAGIPSLLASGALLALYSYCFYMGLKNGAAGAGGVLVTTLNPVNSYIIGLLISRKLPSRNEAAGLLLGITAGCFLLKIWISPSSVFESGNFYFLLASLLWATMSKFTSRGHHYGSSLAFSLWQYLVTLICLLPLISIPELHAAIHIADSLFWINLFFSAAIVTALATTLFFYTTTRIGAEKASSFIFLVPLAAAFSSWVFLGERVLPHTIIGGLLGMAAVYMINKKAPVIIEPE